MDHLFRSFVQKLKSKRLINHLYPTTAMWTKSTKLIIERHIALESHLKTKAQDDEFNRWWATTGAKVVVPRLTRRISDTDSLDSSEDEELITIVEEHKKKYDAWIYQMKTQMKN